MRLIVEWNASANMFYPLKNLLLVILVISKLKCNNLIFNKIMILNISYVCLHIFSLYQELPDPNPERRTPHFGHRHQKNKIIPALTRWPRLDWSLTYEPSFFTNLICARRSNETQIMVLLYGQLKLLLLLLPSAACIHFFLYFDYFLNREINLSETYFQFLCLSHASQVGVTY
jgi:hypothetical protein